MKAYDSGRCDALHDGRVGPLCGAPASSAIRTITSSCPRSSPRSRLAPCRASRRHQMVRHRRLDPLRHAEGRGTRRDEGQRRPDARAPRIRRSSVCSASKASSARPSASPMTGPTGSSSIWATTARASSAMSAEGSKLKIDARPERAMDQGRPAVRLADPLDQRGAGTPGALFLRPSGHRSTLHRAGRKKPGDHVGGYVRVNQCSSDAAEGIVSLRSESSRHLLPDAPRRRCRLSALQGGHQRHREPAARQDRLRLRLPREHRRLRCQPGA